jgi:hypothetical protein
MHWLGKTQCGKIDKVCPVNILTASHAIWLGQHTNDTYSAFLSCNQFF